MYYRKMVSSRFLGIEKPARVRGGLVRRAGGSEGFSLPRAATEHIVGGSAVNHKGERASARGANDVSCVRGARCMLSGQRLTGPTPRRKLLQVQYYLFLFCQ